MNNDFAYIYKISNDINNKIYIGSTTRNLDMRLMEHCFDKRSFSNLYKDIKVNGYQHYKIEELEKVPFEEIQEKKEYWQNFYSQYLYEEDNEGFESEVIILENSKIKFHSIAEMANQISEITLWNKDFLINELNRCLDKHQRTFFNEYIRKEFSFTGASSIEERENWIKDLTKIYSGTSIRCNELNLIFNTVYEAASFIIDSNLYIGNSHKPLEELITLINKQIKNKIDYIEVRNLNLTFDKVPGKTKEEDKDFAIFCPELNQTFNSVTSAAQYLIHKGYWSKMKYKTAENKILNIINKRFDNFKGYSFIKCEEKDC